MDRISQIFNFVSRYMLEPALAWVLDHPLISLLVAFAVVFVSVRNYRML